VFQEEVTIRIKHTAIIDTEDDTSHLTILMAKGSSNEFKPMAGGQTEIISTCFIRSTNHTGIIILIQSLLLLKLKSFLGGHLHQRDTYAKYFIS
jgi:hypothetical protein